MKLLIASTVASSESGVESGVPLLLRMPLRVRVPLLLRVPLPLRVRMPVLLLRVSRLVHPWSWITPSASNFGPARSRRNFEVITISTRIGCPQGRREDIGCALR